MLSGLNDDLPELRNYVFENHAEICTGQVQIDENITEGDFSEKIERATRKLKAHGIVVNLEPTIIAVVGISRFGFCKFGSDELGKIYDELRSEIEICEGKNPKPKLNIARDAIIALSSLNHDYFITADECLMKSWEKVIENNQENKTILQKAYSIPKIVHCKRPKGVLSKIMCNYDENSHGQNF